MTLFDQKLPIAFFETTLDSLDVVVGIELIDSGAQYIGAVIPLCFVPIYILQKIYLRECLPFPLAVDKDKFKLHAPIENIYAMNS